MESGITRAQGWIIIIELGILLIGLYQAGQAAQSSLNNFSNSTAGQLISDVTGIFGRQTPAASSGSGSTFVPVG